MRLYLYTSEKGLLSILDKKAIIVSHPWATNDITEGVAQDQNKQTHDVKKYGYICMSAKGLSPAMWGYYADRGKGACLVFDLPDEWVGSYEPFTLDGKETYLVEVKYGEERSQSQNPIELLSLKSKDWQMEREYRFIIKEPQKSAKIKSESGEDTRIVSEDLYRRLAGVILGPACSKEPLEITARHPHLKNKVIKADIDKTSFDFTLDGLKIPPLKQDTKKSIPSHTSNSDIIPVPYYNPDIIL